MLKRIILALVLTAGAAFAGDSTIIADPNANGRNQPQILDTGGGLPQVNITTPNGNGLSYNRYSQFDVGKSGAILNNSNKNVETQLGGWIESNPNLIGGPAKLIVNEVNSNRPSQLGGFIEIAGQRADVVIANASGISVDGGGFINANRATLTTGIPIIQNGNLVGYEVGKGQIDIQGKGLNNRGVTFTDIVAQSAVVNAGIWAEHLNVVTGQNFVSRDMSEVQRLNLDAETGVSLDVKALGGMYANEIRLVGTGRGVGVNTGGGIRNDGEIVAQVGEVIVNSDGMLSSSGFISGNAGVQLSFGDDIVNTGSIESGGHLLIKTDGSMNTSGSLLSYGDTSIDAANGYENTGSMESRGSTSVFVESEGAFENTGSMVAGKDLDLRVIGDLTNSGSLESHRDMILYSATGSFTNTATGDIISGGDMLIQAQQSFSSAGSIQSDGDMTILALNGSLGNYGLMATNGTLSISSLADMEITGSLSAGRNLKAITEGSFTTSGELQASGTMYVGAVNNFTNTGLMQAGLGFTAIAQTGSFLNNGTIATAADMYLYSLLDMTTNGVFTVDGDLVAETYGSFVNTGDIQVGGNMDIFAYLNFSNTDSLIADGDQTITAQTGTFLNTGLLGSNNFASLYSYGNMRNTGEIITGENLKISTYGNFTNYRDLTAGGTLLIGALGNVASSGDIASNGDLTIFSETGTIGNSGMVGTNSDALIWSEGDITNTGELLAGGNLQAESDGVIANSGDILATGDLVLLASSNILNSGDMIAGNQWIQTEQTFQNTGLLDGGEVVIKAKNVVNVDTGSIFGDHIAIEAENILNGASEDTGHAPITKTKYDPETGEYSYDENYVPVDESEGFDWENVEWDEEIEFPEDSDEFPEYEYEGDEDDGDDLISEEEIGVEDKKDFEYEKDKGTGTSISSGVIVARDRMDIAFANELVNREDGLLYSGGDMYFGGQLDGLNQATGRGGHLINRSATVESGNDIYADVEHLTNYNAHYETEERLISRGNYTGYRFSRRNDPKIYIAGIDRIVEGRTKRGATKIIVPYDEEDYFLYKFTRDIYDTFIIDSRPGYFTAANDITITGDVTNNRSILTAGSGTVDILGKLTNIGAMEATITRDYGSTYWTYVVMSGTIKKKHKRKTDYAGVYAPAPVYEFSERDVTLFGEPDVDQPEGKLGTDFDLDTGNGITTNILVSISTGADFSLSGLNKNLYSIDPDPTSNYLIETNPRLTNYRSWLSSDFMLDRLATDPQSMLKRLGDGYYEQKLIRDQIVNMTGARVLDGFNTDEEQYAALMTAGVDFAEEVGLTIGVALTAEQMEQLTSDIVWLEYTTVQTAEGPQQVLTPTLYLAPGRDIVLSSGGGIISGRNVTVNGEVINSGNILGTESLSITAPDILNSGNMAGGIVTLAALRDINNVGGTIIATEEINLSAGRDINIASGTYTSESVTGQRTDIGRSGIVAVTGEDGHISLNAGNDINLNAATLMSEGTIALEANHDINIAGIEVSEKHETGTKGRNYLYDSYSEDMGSLIIANEDIYIASGNNIAITGSTVYSDGEIKMQSGNDIIISEGRQKFSFETTSYEKSSGFLSKKTQTSHEIVNKDFSKGSEISGNTVQIHSGNDFSLGGSNVVASEGLSIVADGNVNIYGSEDYQDSYTAHERTRKGFSGSIGGGSVGVTYGSMKKGEEKSRSGSSITSSLVGSENGDVVIYAGKDVGIAGSNIIAGTGDVNISGENVNIINQYEYTNSYERSYFEQRGISLGIGLSGGISDTIQSGMQTGELLNRTQNAKSDRAQALFGIAAARNAYDTGKSINNLRTDPSSAKDVGLSINLGFNKTKSESVYSSNEERPVGSQIKSGGDTTIIARGNDENENSGNLNIIGSQIEADGYVTLGANNDINILSAEETSSFYEKDSFSSSGAGIGISVGGDGIGWSVNGYTSKSKGQGSGTSTTHSESVIKGKEGVEFISGNDTTIIGGQIIGEKVTGIVGGDLTISSEQDTFTEEQNRSSKSGGLSAGPGSFGGNYNTQKQKGKSDYASVNEQSGIFAGKDGFDIVVGGHTDLTGAVIASDADSEKNSLVTGSLSVEDIENHSSYEASTKGWGGEFTYQKDHDPDSENSNKGSLSPGLPIKEKGEDSSTTKSAISEGEIVIRNEEEHLARTGETADETIESLNRDTDGAHTGPLDKNPNLKEILDKQSEIIEAAALAAQATAKTVGDISQSMFEKTDDVRWQEGGIYKTLLQAAGSYLVAQLGNGEGLNAALGAIANQLASGNIEQVANAIAGKLSSDPSAQTLISNMISNMLSSGIGTAVGGETGGNLASNMDRYNRQLHPSEIYDIRDMYAELFMDLMNAGKMEGDPDYISYDMAVAILLQQAMIRVDEWYASAYVFDQSTIHLLMAADDFLDTFASGYVTYFGPGGETPITMGKFNNNIIDGPNVNLWENPTVFYNETYGSDNEEYKILYDKYIYSMTKDGNSQSVINFDTEYSKAAIENIAKFLAVTGTEPLTKEELAAKTAEMAYNAFTNADDIEAAWNYIQALEYESDPLTRYSMQVLSGGAIIIYQIDALGNIIPVVGQGKMLLKRGGSAALEAAVKALTKEGAQAAGKKALTSEAIAQAAKFGIKNADAVAKEASYQLAKNASNFADAGKLTGHYAKHGHAFAEFGVKNADDYLELGKSIIKQGNAVEYVYKNGETRIGFFSFLGNNRKGEAKFVFVGTNLDGAITTIHVKRGKDFFSMINGNAADRTIRLIEGF